MYFIDFISVHVFHKPLLTAFYSFLLFWFSLHAVLDIRRNQERLLGEIMGTDAFLRPLRWTSSYGIVHMSAFRCFHKSHCLADVAQFTCEGEKHNGYKLELMLTACSRLGRNIGVLIAKITTRPTKCTLYILDPITLHGRESNTGYCRNARWTSSSSLRI